METSVDQTRRIPEVRKALKEQQLARLAAKAKVAKKVLTSEEYSAMYSSQPAQIAKAEEQAAKRGQRNAIKAALVNAAITNAEGSKASFGGKS
jgi:hypothetical protein